MGQPIFRAKEVRVRSEHAVAKAALWVLALSAFVLTSGQADATTVAKTSVTEMSDLADLVIMGRVTHKTVSWDAAGKSIYTYVTVRVDSRFKGDKAAEAPGRDVTVLVPGGTAPGGVRLHVPSTPQFTSGEKVFLFLERRTKGDAGFNVIGFFLGKLTVKLLGSSEIVVHGYPTPKVEPGDSPHVKARKKLVRDFDSGIRLRDFVFKVRSDVAVSRARVKGGAE